MSILAALLALTSCSDDDNSTSTMTIAEAVLGEWFTQVNANGTTDDIAYDSYAIFVTFNNDGHGIFKQYFLKNGKLVNVLASETDFTVDSKGNISIVINEVNVPLGENARYAGGRIMLDMPDHDLRGMTLVRPTDSQKQILKEWDAIVEEWGGKGSDGGTTTTGVTSEGASEPARARKIG